MMELVDLFCGEGQLGDDIRVGGVAVEGIVLRGDIVAVFLTETVEIILHMEAVHTFGRAVNAVILAAVMAVDGKSIFKAVAHRGFAQGNETVAPGEGIHIHLVLIAVGAVDDLLPHLGPLPLKPMGNVGKFGLAFGGGELTVLLHKPALAAVLAEDLRAFGGHLKFGFAVGALIQHFLQTFCTVGLGNTNIIFQLVAVLVVAHRFPNDGIDLVRGHLCHLLRRQDLAEHRVMVHLAFVFIGPERGVQIVSVMRHHHQRHLVHLHQPAQGIRQEGGGADGGVPGFGIHTQNVSVLDHPADGLDQVNVIGEFPGADGADPGQQPGHHMIAVDVHHITYLPGVGDHGGQLKIDEGLVIAEDDVWGLQALHIDGFQGVFFADEADLG